MKANAARRLTELQAVIADLRSHGFTSVRALTAELNEREVPRPPVASNLT